jgi:hypothetical protein
MRFSTFSRDNAVKPLRYEADALRRSRPFRAAVPHKRAWRRGLKKQSDIKIVWYVVGSAKYKSVKRFGLLRERTWLRLLLYGYFWFLESIIQTP